MKSGWQKSSLGEIIDVLKNGINCKQSKSGIGDKISRIESVSDATFNVFKVGYSKLSKSEKIKYKLDAGDILFSHINSSKHVGKTAIFNESTEVYHGVNLLLIRPKNIVNNYYLKYYLEYLFHNGYWKKTCKQSVNQASVNQGDIKKVEINYPELLLEQKRIVKILNEAFEKLEKTKKNTEKNLENAKELFESYLHSIFSNTESGWEEKKLGDLLELLTDYHANGSYKVLKQNVELLEKEDFAWMVRSTDFEKNLQNKLKYISESSYNFLKKSKLFGGEILMSKIGNAGKVYLMPKIDRPCSLAMNLFLLKLNKKVIDGEFLYYYLISREGKQQIYSRLRGTATKTITKNNVRSIITPVAPIKVQNRIVLKLNTLRKRTSKLEKTYQQKLNNLEELKKSVLEKAFTGEL